jgi:hypothetical protein
MEENKDLTELDKVCLSIEGADCDSKLDQLASALVKVSADDKKKAQDVITYVWEAIKKVEEQNKLVDEEIELAKLEDREPRFKFKRSTTSLLEQLNSATKLSIESTGKLVDLSNILVKIKQIESNGNKGKVLSIDADNIDYKEVRLNAIREARKNERPN